MGAGDEHYEQYEHYEYEHKNGGSEERNRCSEVVKFNR